MSNPAKQKNTFVDLLLFFALGCFTPNKSSEINLFFPLLFASYYTQLESKQHKSKKRVEIKQILTHYEHTLGSFCCC